MLLMNIPLVDLGSQYRTIKPEIMTAFEEVLENMQLFLGPQLQAFETEFAAYCGCHYAVGVASGTDALALALRACNIGPGDEVITVSNTFIATVEAIALVGATPVFVDIDPLTYTMDWRQLDRVLTSRTRAIIPVHLYGHPVEMQPVLEFAHSHGLRVIEDASQAHGATYRGQQVGSFGVIGCFSLYYSKNLGAYGEAGICVTDDEALAENLRKLRYLDQWNAARQEHAQAYAEQLQEVVTAVPFVQPWGTHVYCYYVIQVQGRDYFRKVLEQEGIATGIHYPMPIHLQPACAHYGYVRGMLPVTEALSDRIVSLPLYPELTAEQRQIVVNAVKKSVVLGVSS